MTPTLAAEVQALANIVDELDYYQVLEVEPGANSRAIQLAFHRASRRAHPDARRHWPEAPRRAAERVAKRVTEAYTVLRDPARRRVYDERRAGGRLRLQLAEAQAEAAASAQPEAQARTAQGRRFLREAEADLQRGDRAAAIRNLQMAVTFEAGNDVLRARLEALRAEG